MMLKPTVNIHKVKMRIIDHLGPLTNQRDAGLWMESHQFLSKHAASTEFLLLLGFTGSHRILDLHRFMHVNQNLNNQSIQGKPKTFHVNRNLNMINKRFITCIHLTAVLPTLEQQKETEVILDSYLHRSWCVWKTLC